MLSKLSTLSILIFFTSLLKTIATTARLPKDKQHPASQTKRVSISMGYSSLHLCPMSPSQLSCKTHTFPTSPVTSQGLLQPIQCCLTQGFTRDFLTLKGICLFEYTAVFPSFTKLFVFIPQQAATPLSLIYALQTQSTMTSLYWASGLLNNFYLKSVTFNCKFIFLRGFVGFLLLFHLKGFFSSFSLS